MKANDPQPLAVYAPDLGESTLKKSQGGLGDYIVVWEWTHGLGYELFGPCDDAGAFGEEWQAYHGDCPCWQPVTLQNPFAAPRVVSPSAEDQRAAERAYWSKRLEAAKRELKVAEARVDQCKQRIAHTELQSLAQ